MRKALIVLALLAPVAVAAEPINLLVGGLAYHIGESTYRWDGEEHDIPLAMPMVGIEWEEWTLAAFRNSYGKNSVAFTKSWYWPITEAVTLETKVGTATGYGDTPVNMEVAPLATVGIDYRINKWHTVLSYIPPIQEGMAGVVTLHFKYEF